MILPEWAYLAAIAVLLALAIVQYFYARYLRRVARPRRSPHYRCTVCETDWGSYDDAEAHAVATHSAISAHTAANVIREVPR